MFGFRVFGSIKGAADGKIPYPQLLTPDKSRQMGVKSRPKRGESVLGGHAVLAVGYDDELKIDDCIGAFLIRNSWGEGWGEKGYGWLPYEYLLGGLAEDFWCLVKAEWVDVGEFGV